MSVAIYIVTERDIDGEDLGVDGKSLGAIGPDALARIENSLGVTPTYEFVSQDPDELAEFLDDAELPPEAWFPASRGLETIGALRKHLLNEPSAVPNSAAVIEDLEDFERVLGILAAEDVRFHFAIDF